MFNTFKERFALLFVLGIALYLPLMNTFNTWYDEQYSLYLTSLSWKDMFHAIMTEDSHPPMHYILLRLWMTGMDYHNVGWARLLNLVVICLTALLGIGPVRRLAGDKTALWFTGLTFLFPTMLWLVTNMRMYALVNLEITALTVYALLVLKEGKLWDWMMFLFWGLVLPYTHYFGCFVLAFVNISLFFAFLYKRENLKKNLIKLFSCAGVVALVFMPWFIFVFLTQASFMYGRWFVKSSHAMEALWVLLVPYINHNDFFTTLITTFFMALCWLLLFQYPFDSNNKGKRFLVFLPTALFFEVMITGFILSMLFQPVLLWRYMTPFMGGIVFALSVIMAYEKRFKKIFFVFGGICYLGMYIGLYPVVHDPLYRQIQQTVRRDFSPKDTIFLCNDMQTGMMIHFYLPEYTWQRVPTRTELAIPKKLMYRKTLDEDHLKAKNILLFAPSAGLCEKPLEDKYNHFQELCFIRLSEEDAKKMIANSEKIIYNELH